MSIEKSNYCFHSDMTLDEHIEQEWLSNFWDDHMSCGCNAVCECKHIEVKQWLDNEL